MPELKEQEGGHPVLLNCAQFLTIDQGYADGIISTTHLKLQLKLKYDIV
jgi:hypothetical protein